MRNALLREVPTHDAGNSYRTEHVERPRNPEVSTIHDRWELSAAAAASARLTAGEFSFGELHS